MGDKLLLEADYGGGGEYEPSDSEENYSDDERELLSEVQEINQRHKQRQQERKGAPVLPFADSSDEDGDDDINALMHDSDIEGADGGDDDADIPDAKDWGSKSRSYYHTDFVDQDYSTYNEQEAELAEQEEQEAKLIQLRLAKQMKDADFLFDELPTVQPEELTLQDTIKTTSVKADLSGLNKRQLQELFHKDAPEFAGLVADMERYLLECQELLKPVLDYIRKKQSSQPLIPALQFADLYCNILHTYCSNVAMYLLLKAKRVSIRAHPVTRRLVQLKKLLTQLRERYEEIVRPQLEALLERINDGDVFEILGPAKATVKQTKRLGILDEYEKPDGEDISADEETNDSQSEMAMLGKDSEADAAVLDEDARRSITYQMAKNKGLMPHRKKEQRNPRVKHRSKFRKALIRRKGAVRSVRKETKRYGGEISGIKAGVTKSIKFKV